MIEQVYHLTQGNTKTIEKILMDDEIHYMHMILNKGEGLPEHFSNAKKCVHDCCAWSPFHRS